MGLQTNTVRILLVQPDDERNLRNKGGYIRGIARWHVGVAACMNKLRPTTRDLQTRVAKCTEVDGGILERLLGTAPVLLFKYQIRI